MTRESDLLSAHDGPIPRERLEHARAWDRLVKEGWSEQDIPGELERRADKKTELELMGKIQSFESDARAYRQHAKEWLKQGNASQARNCITTAEHYEQQADIYRDALTKHRLDARQRASDRELRRAAAIVRPEVS